MTRRARNLGETRLARRRSATDAMRDYDRLPKPLRRWLAEAALPWRPASARRAFLRALARTGDPAAALAELDRLQVRLVARDAATVWGRTHPAANLPAPAEARA